MSLAVASRPAAAQTPLDYTQTDFLHGFASRPEIWTTPYSDLGGASVVTYLGGGPTPRIRLGPVGLPFFSPQTTRYAQQTGIMADSVYYQNGRHVLVGHSLGALVARGTYIGLGNAAARKADMRAQIVGIIAVAAPHQGLLLADSAEKAKSFFLNVERRVNDGVTGIRLEVGIVGYLFRSFGGLPLALLADNYLQTKYQNLDALTRLPLTPALKDLYRDSAVVRALNDSTADAAIPRANIVGRIAHKHAALRVSAALSGENEDEKIHARNIGMTGFKACKWVGYVTILGIGPGRKCSKAAKALGNVDPQWSKYTVGTEPGRNAVPRQAAFDGVVANERSRYPGLANPNFDLPVVNGANHQSIYRRRDGVDRILDAMQLMNMGQPQPPLARRPIPTGPLSAAVSGPTSVTEGQANTWSAAVSGGTAPYRYQWGGRVSGTNPQVSASLWNNGTIALDVWDAAGVHVATSIEVAVERACGGPNACE